MWSRLAVVGLISCLAVVTACGGDDSAPDDKPIVGQWTMTSVTKDGETFTLPNDDPEVTLASTLSVVDNGSDRPHGDPELQGTWVFELRRPREGGGALDIQNLFFRVGVGAVDTANYALTGRSDDGNFEVACVVDGDMLSCAGTLVPEFGDRGPFELVGNRASAQ